MTPLYRNFFPPLLSFLFRHFFFSFPRLSITPRISPCPFPLYKQQIVDLLLHSGSNPSLINKSGRTPVDEALSRDFTEIVKLINDFSGAPPLDFEETDDVEPAPGDDVEEMGPDPEGAGPSSTGATGAEEDDAME